MALLDDKHWRLQVELSNTKQALLEQNAEVVLLSAKFRDASLVLMTCKNELDKVKEDLRRLQATALTTERDRDDLQWRLRSEVEESASLRDRFSAMVDHFEGALHTLELKNEALQRETADRGRTLTNAPRYVAVAEILL